MVICFAYDMWSSKTFTNWLLLTDWRWYSHMLHVTQFCIFLLWVDSLKKRNKIQFNSIQFSLSLSLFLSQFWRTRILVGMMNGYPYTYESAEIEGTLTITLTSTAKNGEYSEYASAYDYAITEFHTQRFS